MAKVNFDTIFTSPRLYKRGVRGEVRVWRMELGCIGLDPKTSPAVGHRVVSGILHKKETASGWTLCEPKNVGRKNETSAYEQALAEIEAEYQKKRDRGYFDNIEDIDDVKFVKPMLAHDWAKYKVALGPNTYAQPKLDGIRCIARADGLWTRTGKPITSAPHIVKALNPLFERNPDLVLDGELYNHDLKDDFNAITAIVRKQKLSEADLKKSKQLIQYHIYDMVDEDRVFSRRWSAVYSMIQQLDNPFLRLVQTKQVADKATLDALYGRWLSEGYEGQIIRLDAEYENKRSKNLLKRKEFITEEFPVVATHEGEGNWRGAIKRFTLAMPDGREFGAGVRGKMEDLVALLESERIPRWATVRYFTPTPDGIPRFPVVVDYGFEPNRVD